MTLAELVKEITTKNFLFEISIEGKTFRRKSAAEVLQESPSLEAYFQKVAELNHTDKLGITLYAKNGSSFLRRKKFLLSLNKIVEPINKSVEPINENVEPLNKTVETLNEFVEPINKNVEGLGNIPSHPVAPCPVHGYNHQPQTIPHMDYSTHGQILQVKLDFANQKAQDLERRNKELERKNDELYTENTKLIRENLLHKDKLDLEYRHKELELENEKSGGLNGIMDKIQGIPPEGWQLIAGLFPNHPMNKAMQQQPQLEGIKKHPDADANQCIENISEGLMHQPPEIVGMISTVLSAYMQNPALLKKAYVKLFPPAISPTITPQPIAENNIHHDSNHNPQKAGA